MNAKENALRIIRFDRPERIVGGPPVHGLAYLGCNHEGYEGGGHHLPLDSTWMDIWGTGWHLSHKGVMGFPEVNPLADLSKLTSYQWPDPDDERICGQIYRQAEGWQREETFLCGSHRDTLWEKSYMLGGMENMLCNLHTEPEAVRDIFHHIMDFQLGIAQHYVACGVEMVTMSDDLGTQSGLLMSPEMIEEFLLPEYRRLFGFYKTRGVLVNFHSCGHIEPVLETFIGLGVDILNPLQATANDLGSVRHVTQGRLTLQGGIRSGLIMDGPAEAIREEVRLRIDQLGKAGGYFCAPDQFMPYPEENLRVVWEAVDEFGVLGG